MSNTKIIIQARTGSTRLPKKMILPFYENEGIFSLLLKKLTATFDKNNIILATSVNENIFGIEIGSDINKAEDVLLSYGYSKNENVFTKGIIRIKFTCISNEIKSFEVSLVSEYLGNRIY